MSETLRIKSFLRDYQVHFVEDVALPLRRDLAEGTFFIIDSLVWELNRQRFAELLPERHILVIEANENNKSLETCQKIIETLVDRQVRRNGRLVAVGGGIIQDLTAFSASIIYRGIEWFFFPTTLLAQGDSCIGSKTSINLGEKKNLIGNFYPPTDVFIDTTFLASLTIDDIKSGIGEILHYYLYAANPLFDELTDEYGTILQDGNRLVKYIRESLKIKKSVIENDEFDRGERNKFNYGHTFGHALESATDYAIKHGQAVTVGMDIANFVSMNMGFMRPELFHQLHGRLSVNFPAFDSSKIDLGRYCDFLSRDKKNESSNVGCILAEGPGALFKLQLPLDNRLRNMLQAYFSGRADDESSRR